jgi:phage recombination protein Bet
MAGPVRNSPSALTTIDKSATEQRAQTLIEKFALQMGGVDPSKMMSTLKQTAFKLPDRKNATGWQPQEVTNEQMMALLVVANKYDLNPFIKEIYAFPDKGGIVPIVGVDGWARMINNHPQFDGVKFDFSDAKIDINKVKNIPESCTCTIYRKDRSHPTEVTEYLGEVYRDQRGDYPGPWQTHTRRMLRHKALIQCARLAFGFTGIHDADEAERIIESEYIPADKKAQTLTDRFTEKTTDDVIEVIEVAEVIDEVVEDIAPPTGESYAVEKAQEREAESIEADPRQVVGVDIVADILKQVMSASSAKEIDGILTDMEGFKGISQAKRMIVKKAAAAKKRELGA